MKQEGEDIDKIEDTVKEEDADKTQGTYEEEDNVADPTSLARDNML